MTLRTRSSARVALAVATLLVAGSVGTAARPASAAVQASSSVPCWKSLLNEWYGGRIDHTYAIHCYTQALKHLPPDVAIYSSAHDDIERALQSAIAKETKQHKTVNANTPIPPPSVSSTSTTGTGSRDTNPHFTGSLPTSTTKTKTTTTGVGRTPQPGLTGALSNSGSASSVPVPLLVLGGLALLLVLAGAGGLVLKRFRTR